MDSPLFRTGLLNRNQMIGWDSFFWRVNSAGIAILQRLTHNLKKFVFLLLYHPGVNLMKFWYHKWTLILDVSQGCYGVTHPSPNKDESLTR